MKKQTTEKKYKIGEVAELFGVHEDTLRNWEKEGYITPERIGKRGDRRYTVDHIKQIKDQGLVSDLAKKTPKSKKDFSEYTKDELIKELQILKKTKKYGLVWEDHKEEVVEKCKTQAPILVSKEKRRIKDRDSKKPTNILIEGDNYHALQVLNYTHKGKIDVIYIDPPYNTGSKDFIYNDSYVDKEDNFRHSKWISFIEKRLQLAKNLLKNDGVIFISIDDNEQAQLKLLCDAVFGEGNFIANLPRQTRSGGGAMSRHVATNHDYILMYASNKQILPELFIPYEKEYLKRYKEEDNVGRYFWDTFIRRRIGNNNVYKITLPSGKKVQDKWNLKEASFKDLSRKGDIKFIEDGDNWSVQFKQRIGENGKKTPSIILDCKNDKATEDIRNIFGDRIFDYPKPVDLIEKLVSIATSKNSGIILDFMAGSGTTGHAVLELNKEDGGNRKFILCTNNENNIAEDVTHERIKRVSKGYTTLKGEKIEGLGGSLEYFKTEFVDVENIEKVSDKKKLEFTHEAGQMIALKEDSFKEVEKNKHYQIFTNKKDKFVGIYFRENLEKLPEMEKKILDKEEVKLYIFSHGGSDFVNDYADYKNISVEHIPEPILKVYKSLNS